MLETFKIVYNNCYGGFSLSEEAVELGKSLAPNDPNWIDVDIKYGIFEGPRHDKTLIMVVEKLGDKSSGSYACLAIKEIASPFYRITEYDGVETVEIPTGLDWIDARDGGRDA